jgi:hypothetical protein
MGSRPLSWAIAVGMSSPSSAGSVLVGVAVMIELSWPLVQHSLCFLVGQFGDSGGFGVRVKQASDESRYCPTISSEEQKSYARSMTASVQGFGFSGDPGIPVRLTAPPRQAAPATPPEEGNSTYHPSGGGEFWAGYSPPLEGCPKGGVVVGGNIAVIFIEVGNTYHHPVRLRLPPLGRRGILGGVFPSFVPGTPTGTRIETLPCENGSSMTPGTSRFRLPCFFLHSCHQGGITQGKFTATRRLY